MTKQRKTKMFIELGKYLRDKRTRAKLSQGDVAKLAGYTTPQFVSNIERGISPPSIEFLKIVKAPYKLNPKTIATTVGKATANYYRAELR